MIKLEIKKLQYDINEEQQKYKRHRQVKLINTNILEVEKY